jgi:hypothetical protein
MLRSKQSSGIEKGDRVDDIPSDHLYSLYQIFATPGENGRQ